MAIEHCSWCGTTVPLEDGLRLSDPVHRRHAVFCRLEHVVPWVMQGSTWDAGSGLPTNEPGNGLGRCAECGDELGDRRLLLVRHRQEHRIADALCSMDHLLAWAKSGGRWRAGGRS
jgi:hypothetical protein